MEQSSVNWSDPDFDEGAERDQLDDTGATLPDSDSTRSPNTQLADQSDPVGDSARAARATNAQTEDSGQSVTYLPSLMRAPDQDAARLSTTLQASPGLQSDADRQPTGYLVPMPNPSAPQSAAPQSAPDPGAPAAPAMPDPGSAPAPRQRIRQIGQIQPIAPITPMAPPQLFHTPLGDPDAEAAAQSQDQAQAQQMVDDDSADQRDQQARQIQARDAQIQQINASDPYQGDDGRWKKQMVDPETGAINEHDIIDSGMGKIDTRTGNIYAQTSQGPQWIGVDPQQKLLAQIVGQKTLAQAQGSQIAVNIATAQSALLDTQQQLQTIQGIPDRMNAQIGKYTQASLDPSNTYAADQLQKAQAAFAAWKAQNPRYTELTAKRDALANQIQTQQAAKAQNDAQVAQLLTTQQYVQWNGNLPPSMTPATQDASGSQGGPAISPASPSPTASPTAPGASAAPAPPSDISIRDVDTRAGVIAAQTGLPAGLAYVSALGEAKQQGAQTVDGSVIDDAIKGIQPFLASQLPKMTGPQLRQAVQSGLISKSDAVGAMQQQKAAAAQAQDSADNGVGAVTDFATRALSKFSSVINRAGEGFSRWAGQIAGDTPTSNNPQPGIGDVNNFADLAKWFKGNAEDIESVGKGAAGLVNPSMNKSAHATVADAVGFTAALAAGGVATAPLLPEIAGASAAEVAGMSVAGKALQMFAPGALVKMLPALAIMAPMASAEAFDAAKAKDPAISDADATKLGMIAAAKQIPMILIFHGMGGAAGALESKVLPGVINPLARTAARFVTGAAANVAGSAAVSTGENIGAALGVPGMQARPILDRSDLISALAFAGHPAIEAGIHEAGMPAMIAKAQDTVAGSDPTIQSLQRGAKNSASSPQLQQQYADKAAAMQSDAAAFLKANNAPQIAPGAKNDPQAQSVVDLTAKAADLRNKIQTAFATGGADGAKDLATHRTDLDNTESQLHAATQEMVNRVPADMQARIAKAAAPDVDWDDARQQNAQDPMAHFATENLGAALRDQDIPPDRQQAIRQYATKNGINPDIADHIANQAVGAKAVKDLTNVIRGGSIDSARAQTLKDMGFLQQSDPSNPASPLHVTEDAQRLLPPGVQKFVQLKPDAARYSPSSDPAHGSVLYQNAVGGMDHFSKTAEQMLPRPASESQPMPGSAKAPEPSIPAPKAVKPGSANGDSENGVKSPDAVPSNAQPGKRTPIIPGIEHPDDAAERMAAERTPPSAEPPRPSAPEPTAAEKIRDEIGATLWGRYPQVLESRLAGHTPEEMGARLGITPENAARASEEVAANVGRLMQRRGVSAEETEKALSSRSSESRASGPTVAEKIRDEIGATLWGRYPQVLESRLAGHTPEEMGARLGITPENAARASEEVAANVGRQMQQRGVSAEEAEKALAPRSSESRPPGPTAAEKIRDEIGATLWGRYPQVLESRLAGHTPEEMGARLGITPENAARASADVAANVGRLMRRRGVSAEETEKALAPKTPASPDTLSASPEKTSDEVPGKENPIDASSAATSKSSPTESVRDEIASRLVDPARSIFQARMDGKTPEEIAEKFGVTPEVAARASDTLAAHVESLMKERGVDLAEARRAVTPRTVDDEIDDMMDGSGPTPTKAQRDAVFNQPRKNALDPQQPAKAANQTADGAANADSQSNHSKEGAGGGDSAKPEPTAGPDPKNGIAAMKKRVAGKAFKGYDALRRFLIKHKVRLSIDPEFLLDDTKPLIKGEEKTVAAFYPLAGEKAMFYIRSDATRYEVLHELGHFVDWLKNGKPGDLGALSEQAAYDFLRNNKTRWKSLNEAERRHADWYLICEGGTPNLQKN